MTSGVRRADPWRDTDVIDVRAPRFNQAFVGLLALTGVLTGWWPLFALLALHLAVGIAFGRRFCITCVAYFRLIQPRFGEGRLEDSRPPRFANMVGVAVLTAATAAFVAGEPLIGLALGGLVATLALLAAISGLCVGCELYRIGARLRRIQARQLVRIDPHDLEHSASGPFVVQFSHPLCTECHRLERDLQEAGREVVTIDVRERPDLARKYGVAAVPVAVAVTADGQVTARIAG
jgi:thiol-disulfide isomerase/thioredoxin